MSYLGWKRPLVVDDLWELNPEDKTSHIAEKFERYCKPTGWGHARQVYVKIHLFLLQMYVCLTLCNFKCFCT